MRNDLREDIPSEESVYRSRSESYKMVHSMK